MNILKSIKKIQNLPLQYRKIVFGVIVAVVAIIFGFLWIKITKERIQKFSGEDFLKMLNFPSFKEEKLQFPGIGLGDEEKEKKINELMESLQKNPEQLEKFKKAIEENPQIIEELIKNPEKLEEFIKNLESGKENNPDQPPPQNFDDQSQLKIN